MLPPAWVDPAVLRPLEPGDPHDVGGYQVLGLLGTGGMGRVLLARTQSGR
ncbi:MAG: hypothetical protein JWL97_4428, partial [Gemmatimonadales bacterium]|nr:hypothetical protein [Gemmatimonadales bacterium]